MPKSVKCLECGANIMVRQNPHFCPECQKGYNVVTRSIPIRLGDLNQEQAEKLLKESAEIVNYALGEFAKRFWPWRIIEKEKGFCLVCKEEKNLTMQRGGDKFCSNCGADLIYDSQARKELYPGMKDKFPIPRKTFVDSALRQAQLLFGKWLSDNWAPLLKRGGVIAQLKECQDRGRGKSVEGEPARISQLRETWANLKTSMSPFWFFFIYKEGRQIKQRNRKQRRESLKALAKQARRDGLLEKATLPQLAYLVAKPVCEECDYAEEFNWGWECLLEQALGRTQAQSKEVRKAIRAKRIRVGKLPVFQGTVVQIPKEGYAVDGEEAEVILYEKGPKEKARVLGVDWLEQKYGQEAFQDDTRYPDLYRPSSKKDKEYYLIYPLTEVVPIQPGPWQHTVAYGPTKTCVLSVLNGERKVRFFGKGVWQKSSQGGIIPIKEYHSAQKRQAGQQAKPGYFEKPRLKEGRMIKLILHQEAKEIAGYLAVMPGKVALLNMQKEQFPRGTDERKELNKKLGRWGDSIFRPLAAYKLMMAGLVVKEQEFKTTNLAKCPYCGIEVGGSWQELVIHKNKKSIACSCGKDINILLAIAEIASRMA